jgi:hypothetical protein
LKELVQKNDIAINDVKTEFKTVKGTLGEILEAVKKTPKVGFVIPGEGDNEILDVDKVLFLEDESKVQNMTIDTACPNSMTSRDTMEKYLEANKMRQQK